jgi:hydroxymethylpyrimidine/phosphomethylpyrimidine kinase
MPKVIAMKNYYKALTIAGSDSGGGAGIQADLKTFSALGCYGMSVIAALTAQNTLGVQGVYPIPAEFVSKQLNSILMDMGTDAIKIGMLHSADIITVIAQSLKNNLTVPIVVDPVMLAKDGSLLLELQAVDALITELFPLATLITPNIPEAEVLLKEKINDQVQMEMAAKKLAEWGSQAVLLKGGHLTDAESADCLYLAATDQYHWFKSPKILTTHTHGTGCTLSSAITAYLAKGLPLLDAVAKAKQYINSAIIAGSDHRLGQGYGPVHHFFKWWN